MVAFAPGRWHVVELFVQPLEIAQVDPAERYVLDVLETGEATPVDELASSASAASGAQSEIGLRAPNEKKVLGFCGE